MIVKIPNIFFNISESMGKLYLEDTEANTVNSNAIYKDALIST